MELLLRLYTNQFLVFVLVLTRVSGLMVLAPVWGSRVIPLRVRAFLAIGVSLIISPLLWHTPLDDPGRRAALAGPGRLRVRRGFVAGSGRAHLLRRPGTGRTAHGSDVRHVLGRRRESHV